MTYTMIVVDDEEIIRNGLSKFIEMSSSKFRVVGTFEDGKDAINFLERHPVDLIFTDVKMTEVSGLALADYICQNCPGTETVILSGYKEFEYVQQAMESKVRFYLLKPIKNREIISVLEKLGDELDKRRQSDAKLLEYDEMLSTFRSQFFSDIIFGILKNDEEIKKRFNMLRFNNEIDALFCAIVQIIWPEDFMNDKWQYGKIGACRAVTNYFDQRKYCDCIVELECNRYVLIMCRDEFEKALDDLQYWGLEVFGVKLITNLEYKVKGISSLANYTNDMSVSRQPVCFDEIMEERLKLLNTYLNLRMYDEAKELFSELILKYSDKKMVEIMKKTHFFDDLNKDNIQIWSNEAREFDAGQQLEVLFERKIEQMRNNLENEKDIISKIKNYVKVNYSKDISMESVANSVYLQSAYMSRLFKQLTGQNFSDYLLDVRMSNAIRLLRSNQYKDYQVSQMVGYKSSKYFSKLFKHYTGYTPKTYCREVWYIDIEDS